MAERRMFSKSVVGSDAFLDMPASARCLYFHLGMQADDDGFISSPKAIIRSSNCCEDDLKLLIGKGFVIAFNSGIIVIRHWKMHNYIQKDRYKPTVFKVESGQLAIENGIYECTWDVSRLDTQCIQIGHKADTQVSKGEERDRVVKNINSCMEPNEFASMPPVIQLALNDKSMYPVTQKDVEEWKKLYPAVDVMQQLRNMSGWLDSNPTKRKTKRGIRRFINSWLAKEQDKGGRKIYEVSGRNVESESSTKLWSDEKDGENEELVGDEWFDFE